MPTATTATPPGIPQMQQAAFMQNSQLPGFDMPSVLQGITAEQLAYIGQLYQAGLIPLPQAPAQAPALPTATNAQAQFIVQQNGTANPVSRQEQEPMLVDKDNGDREDGELSPQREPDFLHPPPTGPRKRSGSVHMRPGHDNVDKRAKRQLSPPRQPQGYDRRRPEPRTDGHTSSPPRSQFRQRKAKQDAAKDFVLAMYRAGYAFDDIAREVGDARVLRVLFTDLGLNAPTEKPQPQQPQSTSVFAQAREKNQSVSASATPAQGSQLSTTVAKPAIKPIVKPVAIAKAPATADRSAYLARLQAAKNKKNEASLANTEASPVATPATSQVPQAQPPPIAPVVPVQTQPTPAQPKKAKVQTELIRQRLEALKGEQARRQEAERLANAAVAASSVTNVTPGTPSVNLSAPQTPATSTDGTSQNAQVPNLMTTTVAQEPLTAISTQPAPAQASDFTSQFPGLPGLFMTGTPPQLPAAAQKPTAPVVAPRIVTEPVPAVDGPSSLGSLMGSEATSSVEADADLATYNISIPAKQSVASSGQATPKHPFNQSRYDSNDESVIIHVSDEEDSEIDDLEEDEDFTPAPAPKSAASATKPGPLRNFPAPSISANASAPTTPGATTPGGSAYERKLQEINEMHRRIAEMQKQPRKAKAKSLSSTTAAPTSVAPTSSVTNALPGLTSVADHVSVTTGIASHPVEQQQQQMEAKLAQLEEEAENISEQRQAASQPSIPTFVQEANDVPGADSSTSSDDDDAMDLSSGDERESEEIADEKEPAEADMDLDSDSGSASVPIHSVSANELATMSDSGSDSEDSSDSSTDSEDEDSEDEDSEDDYEPAPAMPDDAGGDALQISADPLSQNEPPTSTVNSPEVISSMPTPQTMASPQDVDLAPELQPPRSEQAPSNVTPEATTKPYYKPYESPLRMFKDYRFHPQFTSNVQGGFKSLTYSNKLDPTETMCPNELSNGTCQDQSCLHQHFYNTAINDGELLKDLGTHNAPWKTEEEKIRWSNGLSEIIKQLRDSNQGTDVNAIAARIAQYRRDFVGNPDQILNLNSASTPQ
ncbi:hypothetical protein MBLNU13_g00203t1 [Cladosporium sp. NU13]